jgi:putative hydroxymethylpyrimidine transport system substrate-binding protein
MLNARPAARPLTALAALAAALIAAGCGSLAVVKTSPAPQPYTIALGGTPGPDEAPILVAQANGYTAAAGLETKFTQTVTPLQAVSEGHADMAIVSEPELLQARSHGTQAVAVAALMPRPLSSMITLTSKGGEQHAAGHVVGTDGGDMAAAELQTIDSTAHAVDVGAQLVGSLTNGRLDQTLGATWNYQALEPALARKHPVVQPVDTLGVPTYDALVLAVSTHDARYRGQDIRALMQAFSRGASSVRTSPDAAARIVSASDPTAPAKLIRESIDATLAGLPVGVAWGYMSEAHWRKFGDWMSDHALVSATPQISDCTALEVCPFTNEYLPGEGI